jgi:tetratricopeptide (TPR) repeat protein
MTVAEAITLALGYHQAGDLARAEQIYRQILQSDPRNADALHLLGVVTAQQGRKEMGIALITRALDLEPNNAILHHNLGLTYQDLGKLDETVACYQNALRLAPDYAEAYLNLGVAQAARGRLEEASAAFEQALHYRPDDARASNNLGVVLKDLGRLDDAIACYRRALRLRPDDAEFHNNLGVALKEQLQLSEALASFREALRLRPSFPEAHWNQATTLLLAGDFAQGWPEYEWRRRCSALAMPVPRGPSWEGDSLQGKTILVRAEQGLGDTLQFIRFTPLLKQRGATVIAECQPQLAQLLASCPGVDWAVAQGCALPAFDVEVPLLSLPGLLQVSPGEIPAAVPYVFADAERLAQWCERLRPFSGFRVGLVWKGNPAHTGDMRRSVALARLASLPWPEEVHLFGLQVGPDREQLASLADQDRVIDLAARFDPASFADAAAAVSNLDLVLTVDTAVAHLAGALAMAVWVILPFAPDWRWLLEREDSPWYPTMRLFRQPRPGDWDTVFARVMDSLRIVLERRMASCPTGSAQGTASG